MTRSDLSRAVIGAAIEVHRELGPGLLERAYESCLTYELRKRALDVERQHPISVSYKDVTLDCGYRLDMLVDERLVVELKSVQSIDAVHRAQMLSYLRQSDADLALLINFNVELLKHGIERWVDDE